MIDADTFWTALLVSGPIALALMSAFGLLNARRWRAPDRSPINLALFGMAFVAMVILAAYMLTTPEEPVAGAPYATPPA